ncbi:MAG: DUF1957 domain-containing protein [Elusimicrobiales bacterium]|nr:DUF1957 domain-containing protein [Elusimicrobiales bacterium]
MYRHLHKATERMIDMANRYYSTSDNKIDRILKQCAREIVLAQSSDWPFLMTVGTAKTYSTKRFVMHIQRFTRLWEMLNSNNIDEGFLKDVEWRDNIFPHIDWRAFSTIETEKRFKKD